MVYQPKKTIDQTEEVKEEEKKDISDTVKLCYDPQWLKILKYTQKMIPLTSQKYDFRFLDTKNADIVKEIADISIEEQDMTIPFIEEEVYVVKYKKVHPQSARFVSRFGLDLRMFDRDIQFEDDTQTGKRNYKEAFKQGIETIPEEEFKKKEQQLPRQPKVKDSNEIDLDDL